MANKFNKISKDQYVIDRNDKNATAEWEDIKLPVRATHSSAGYDFFAPFDLKLAAGETIKVPTGISVELDADKFLMVVPRSGLGFKYRLQLDNTVGIIDSDYIFSDNEGHIWIKLTNDSREGKNVEVYAGDAFAQGIILNYNLTDDDVTKNKRNGGFGSTSRR